MRKTLRSGRLILDGGMGTALIAQGLETRAPAWNLSNPDAVRGVHADHVKGGAQLVLTNTFVGASAKEATAAVELARESGARWVAGSLWAGLPDLSRQIEQLGAADAIWLESATSAQQAIGALRIAVACTKLPIVVTCAMTKAPLKELRDEGATATGYNCAPWPDDAAGADVIKPDWHGLGPKEWAGKLPKARLRGGCCGTDGRYLAALRATSR